MILPPPTDPGLTIDVGSIELAMPKLGEAERIVMKEPDNPSPLPDYPELAPSATRRSVTRDLTSARTEYRIQEDTGLHAHPDTGLATRQLREELWTITANDPLSMSGQSTWTCDMVRPGWFVRTISTARMTCTKDSWILGADIIAYDGDELFFEKKFEKVIPRDMM
jgi:hypothetical protein